MGSLAKEDIGLKTVILGANGKLGGILRHFGVQAGLHWLGQSRQAGCDILWSGEFDDPASHRIFQQGNTLINMIGDTGCNENILQQINVAFVKDLLEHAAKRGIAHVVLASSAAVYGSTAIGHFDEDSPTTATSAYGRSKIAMESAARDFSKANPSVRVTVLRIGNVAGADMLFQSAKTHVVQAIARQLDQFAEVTAQIR